MVNLGKIDLLKKTAKLSLDKAGIGPHRARVGLALDVSASMERMYRDETVTAVCAQILGLALNFDDDGDIEVFSFGSDDRIIGTLKAKDFERAAAWVLKEIGGSLQGSTNYAGVINRAVGHYFGQEALPGGKPAKRNGGSFDFGIYRAEPGEYPTIPCETPVYLLFVTDGDNQDKPATREAIINASRLGMYIQFVGVGRGSFQFLKELDGLVGRSIDNAGFFSVNNPANIDAGVLYDMMLKEYPAWVKAAKAKGIIVAN